MSDKKPAAPRTPRFPASLASRGASPAVAPLLRPQRLLHEAAQDAARHPAFSKLFVGAEALPGNDCQLFAVRGDGYFLGTGGGAGLSVSSEECIKARAEKVTCDASVSLGVANQYNSAAEQSWLQHVSPAQQQQIIEHGMRNTQRISDNAVAKSGECTKVNQPEAEQALN